MTKFEEGVERVMYVLGALDYERPSLATLCKFLTIHPRGSVRRVPAHVHRICRRFGNRGTALVQQNLPACLHRV